MHIISVTSNKLTPLLPLKCDAPGGVPPVGDICPPFNEPPANSKGAPGGILLVGGVVYPLLDGFGTYPGGFVYPLVGGVGGGPGGGVLAPLLGVH